MSIADLREYTKLAQRGGTTLEATCDMLIGHRSHVEQKTDEWQNALALINEKIQFYSDWIEEGDRLGMLRSRKMNRIERAAGR